MRHDHHLVYVTLPVGELTRAMGVGLEPSAPENVGAWRWTRTPTVVDRDSGLITLGVVRGTVPSIPSGLGPDPLLPPPTETLTPWAFRAWSSNTQRWQAITRFPLDEIRAWWAALSAPDGPNVLALRRLAGQGFDVDVTGNGMQTALHEAAQNTHLDLVELLLDLGANPRLRRKNGMGVLHEAAGITQRTRTAEACVVIDRLLDHGVPVDHPIGPGGVAEGASALWLAAYNGQADLVQHLAGRGASIATVNVAGDTARAIALQQGFTDVLDVLVDAERQALRRAMVPGDVSIPAPIAPCRRRL